MFKDNQKRKALLLSFIISSLLVMQPMTFKASHAAQDLNFNQEALQEAATKKKSDVIKNIQKQGVQKKEFRKWVNTTLRQKAVQYGLGNSFLDRILPQIHYVPRVSKQQKVTEQPEFKDTFDHYFSKYSSRQGIEKGRQYYRRYKSFVDSLGTGIPASVPITLWWMESRFSQYLGSQKILDALATVYFERQRHPAQLLSALKNVQLGLIDIDTKASWAGCIGGVQFNPDNYRKLTKDGNGDGVVDLFHTPEDILASAVNLLDKAGWHDNKSIGQLVSLPKNFDNRLASPRVSDPRPQPVSFWRKMGVTALDGTPLPDYPYKMSIYHVNTIDHPSSRAFLASPNFNVMWENWNKAYKFVITAALISELIENPQQPYTLDIIKEKHHENAQITPR